MAKMHPPPQPARWAPPLAGRAAVVTGASSGIGRAIAIELAFAGADVLVHARANRRGAEETAGLVESAGRKTGVAIADIADEEQAQSLIEAAYQWQGDIHIWVNNAGADVLTGEAAKLAFDDKLQRLWQTDAQGTMRLARLVGRRMCEKETPEATILNMGWDQAAAGMAGDSGEMFAAVKGAVMAWRNRSPRRCASTAWRRVGSKRPGARRPPTTGNSAQNRKACCSAGARRKTSPGWPAFSSRLRRHS